VKLSQYGERTETMPETNVNMTILMVGSTGQSIACKENGEEVVRLIGEFMEKGFKQRKEITDKAAEDGSNDTFIRPRFLKLSNVAKHGGRNIYLREDVVMQITAINEAVQKEDSGIVVPRVVPENPFARP
ncbi:MAG: hypothetical protein KGL39_37815, partial [Patescibacteria group bacterium]|nr:hypothetical protein [Patescibacteria group bacterium]